MADNQTILIIHNNKKESKMKRFSLVVSFSVIAGCANIEKVEKIAINWGNDEIYSTIPSELSSQFAATTILRINKAVLSVLENAYPFAMLGYHSFLFVFNSLYLRLQFDFTIFVFDFKFYCLSGKEARP